jgi:hypothetical protein
MAARASSRPWRRATAIAVAIHAVLLALAIRSVKITAPAPEPQAIDVQLIQLQPPVLRRERPQTAPSSAPAAAALTPPAPAGIAPAAVAPAALPSPSDDAAGRIRSMLRGSTGCDSAAFLKLSEAEQQTCAKWRMAHADPNLQLRAPIDPVKKSWFDASLKYREAGRYMPIGPPGRRQLVPGLPPGHVVKLGKIPIPVLPGAFNDDDAPPP